LIPRETSEGFRSGTLEAKRLNKEDRLGGRVRVTVEEERVP